jgi:hypothetical protein
MTGIQDNNDFLTIMGSAINHAFYLSRQGDRKNANFKYCGKKIEEHVLYTILSGWGELKGEEE